MQLKLYQSSPIIVKSIFYHNIFYRHLLQDTTIKPTTIEKAVQRATTNIVVFAIPKG